MWNEHLLFFSTEVWSITEFYILNILRGGGEKGRKKGKKGKIRGKGKRKKPTKERKKAKREGKMRKREEKEGIHKNKQNLALGEKIVKGGGGEKI